jgi:Flp pilus assembly protein TadG
MSADPFSGGIRQTKTGAKAVMTARGLVNRWKGESGQAIVEFVIVLPSLFALIFLLVYAGIGFNRQLVVTDAARVGARAGAVARFENPQTTPCDAATQAATRVVGSLSITVNCAFPNGTDVGDPFEFSISYVLDVELPFLPLSAIDLNGSATERLE